MNSGGTIWLIAGRDKGFRYFLKDFSLEVNIIAQIESKLAVYDVTVQYVSHNATDTPAYL